MKFGFLGQVTLFAASLSLVSCITDNVNQSPELSNTYNGTVELFMTHGPKGTDVGLVKALHVEIKSKTSKFNIGYNYPAVEGLDSQLVVLEYLPTQEELILSTYLIDDKDQKTFINSDTTILLSHQANVTVHRHLTLAPPRIVSLFKVLEVTKDAVRLTWDRKSVRADSFELEVKALFTTATIFNGDAPLMDTIIIIKKKNQVVSYKKRKVFADEVAVLTLSGDSDSLLPNSVLQRGYSKIQLLRQA